MRKGLMITLLFLFGCTAATIPIYLPEKKPYVKRFYADYDAILLATEATLKDLGWEIEDKVSPSVYEAARASDLNEKQLLIITQVRQFPFFVGTRYARMNIFLRSRAGISELEIRYLTLSTVTFKKMKDYSNDAEIKRIFGKVEEVLQSPSEPQQP
jgi:hypothetical protein